MKTLLFRCPPGGQYHFGKIALDDKTSLDRTSTIYHSDTLASAIVATGYRVLKKEKADDIRDWFKEGKVRLSSFFYCLENTVGRETRRLFFLPKPVHLDTGDYHEPKKVRNIIGVSKGVWKSGLWWTNDDKEEKTVLPAPCSLLDHKFMVLKEELAWLGCSGHSPDFKLYSTDAIPKVKIHQPKREDNLYFHGNIFLNSSTFPSVHFYALSEHELTNEEWAQVISLLQIIADEGIGGERSVGCGRLLGVQEIDDFELSLAEASNRYATLNLVSPADDADLGRLLAWKTVTRGGRFVSSKKNTFRLKMVAEGALSIDGLKGKFHDISNQANSTHLRFGHALSLQLPKNYAEHGEF